MLDQQVDIWINRAEGVWLKPIEAHITALFSGVFLPSHDHTHHRRVWNISRKLIRAIGQHNNHFDYPTVEGILIAAWFHDVGMVHTTDEKHGAAGSDMCRAYLMNKKRVLPESLEGSLPESLEEVLEAILKHDQKKDRIYSGIVKERRPEILSILSIADDLEAMGTIGIYRYSEIYLERGVPVGELGEQVLRNATQRFDRLSGCELCGDLVRSYEQEYKDLVSFFEQYTRQLAEHGHPDGSAGHGNPERVEAGPLGVVNHIRTLGLKGHVRPEDLWTRIRQNGPDPFVYDYFESLKNELEKARG